MCPACMAATALVAAKVASTAGVAAYGVKRILSKPRPTPIDLPLTSSGAPDETTENRNRR
jgi:hypothetical protein